MNTWRDELQVLNEVKPSRDLWSDALARARSTGRRPSSGRSDLWGIRAWRLRTVVLACVGALAFAAAGSAFAYELLGPSPGFTAGLSGLESLPTVPWPSSLPKGGIESDAAATGLTTSEAEQRLRLAQSGLSLGDANTVDIYAFPGNGGAACVFATAPLSGGICLPTWMTSNPALDGLAWAAWGGDGPRAATGPVAFFGLAADNIRTVESDVSGVAHDIPIVNNSFYAAYDQITSSDSLKLVVQFKDGTTRTFSAPNPYAGD